MKDYYIVGKLVGAHGVHGEVKVFPITDHVRRFSKIKNGILLTNDEKKLRDVVISSARITDSVVLLTFVGITDRDEAQKLNGLFLAVLREDAAQIPKGRYFIADMLGSTIIDDKLGTLGILSDILQTGASDIFVVPRKGKPDLLIPYLHSVVYNVDISGKEIHVNLPEGLYEIYES